MGKFKTIIIFVLVILSMLIPAGVLAKEPVKIVIAGAFDPGYDGDLLQNMLKGFDEAHPDIKVEVLYAVGEKFLLTVANNKADVIWLVKGGLEGWRDYDVFIKKHRALLDITSYWDRDKLAERFIPAIAQAARSDDGRVYGVPFEWNNEILYYNAEVFDKLGLNYPDETWTMDTLRRMAPKLTQADTNGDGKPDRYAWVDASLYYPWSWVWRNGSDFISDDGSRFLLDSGPVRDAVDFWYSLYQMNTVTLGASFPKGEVALFSNGPFYWIALRNYDAHELQWGATVPIKGTKNRANLLLMNLFSIVKTTKHPNEAWEVVKWLTTPKMGDRGLDAWTFGGLKMSPCKDTSGVDYLQKANPPAHLKVAFRRLVEAALRAASEARSFPIVKKGDNIIILSDVRSAWDSMRVKILNGQLSPINALISLNKEMNAKLEASGK